MRSCAALSWTRQLPVGPDKNKQRTGQRSQTAEPSRAVRGLICSLPTVRSLLLKGLRSAVVFPRSLPEC